MNVSLESRIYIFTIAFKATPSDFITIDGAVNKRGAFNANIDADDLADVSIDSLDRQIEEDDFNRWTKTWQKHEQMAISCHARWAMRTEASEENMFIRYERDFHREVARQIEDDFWALDVDVRELAELTDKKEHLGRVLHQDTIIALLGHNAPLDVQDKVVEMCQQDRELQSCQPFLFLVVDNTK